MGNYVWLKLYRYEYYYSLVRDFPDLQFTINGGINTIDEVFYESISITRHTTFSKWVQKLRGLMGLKRSLL